MRGVDLSSREVLVGICPYLVDYKMGDPTVGQAHRNPVTRLQEPQQIEHRRSLTGVDMSQDDGRADLSGGRPKTKPSRLREIGRDALSAGGEVDVRAEIFGRAVASSHRRLVAQSQRRRWQEEHQYRLRPSRTWVFTLPPHT